MSSAVDKLRKQVNDNPLKKVDLMAEIPIADNADNVDILPNADIEQLVSSPLSGDTADRATDIKAEKITGGLKISHFFKLLDEPEDRTHDIRIQAYLPPDVMRMVDRLAFKLADIAMMKQERRNKVGTSTVLKILITEAANRVEQYIDKERDKLVNG